MFYRWFGKSMTLTRKQSGLGSLQKRLFGRKLFLEVLEDRTVLSVSTPTTFTDSNVPAPAASRCHIAANADTGKAADTILLNAAIRHIPDNKPAARRMPLRRETWTSPIHAMNYNPGSGIVLRGPRHLYRSNGRQPGFSSVCGAGGLQERDYRRWTGGGRRHGRGLAG